MPASTLWPLDILAPSLDQTAVGIGARPVVERILHRLVNRLVKATLTQVNGARLLLAPVAGIAFNAYFHRNTYRIDVASQFNLSRDQYEHH